MTDDPAFLAPIDPYHAHRAEDPFGYAISHQRDAADNIVALILIRLSSREEVGRYPSRDALDAAVAAQQRAVPDHPEGSSPTR